MSYKQAGNIYKAKYGLPVKDNAIYNTFHVEICFNI